jgi:hypothetical protein
MNVALLVSTPESKYVNGTLAAALAALPVPDVYPVPPYKIVPEVGAPAPLIAVTTIIAS